MKTNTLLIPILFFMLLPLRLYAGIIGCLGLPKDAPCEQWRECMNAPEWYCDCRDAIPFRYGMDTLISDTTWFSATLNDISKGLTAYWFADNAVTFDIFLTCTQESSTMSFTVGKNSAYNLDYKEIEEKMNEYGSVIGGVVSSMTVRIRVAPRGGVLGRAILTPYDEGPHSVCSNPLPIYYNITYVSSNVDNVYRFSINTIPKPMLVRWVQTNNLPVKIEVTYGSCDGDVVAAVSLADSSKVWMVDAELLQRAYTEKQALYFHFYSQHVGRIRFIAPFTTETSEIDVTACQGVGLQLADTTLLESTVYCDTVYLVDAETAVGTLWLNTYNLVVEPPLTTTQTIFLKPEDFPYLYRYQYVVRDYGTYDVLIQESGKCDEQVLLTVMRPVNTSFSALPSEVTLSPVSALAGTPFILTGVEKGNLKVFSIVGECVLSLPVVGTTEFILPVAGQYIVQVQTEQGMGKTKIIIL
ncbi:MAG: T9SS type A sorting domain-containing protein [Paludibacter sp.]|nr:T9SS type A sorting domain-containing protein [Bacteroidales bacterium]MCM1069425.1 T9SS type A sorting domain-containing protein [Prevotella sp.]MCM1353800.1 T9SS type A sorting domain-containing protein [Bacteroides sp.]MCM1442799.1 T9SS type A sorting domain-containing protein [Muribaculum sp.]MCM1481835.1 T9SS type A sorting domain-containing protein [Paludibacter sp.]